MQPKAQEKIALVTGSGKRRVGSAIVDALAAHGYGVAIHYHTSTDEAQQEVQRLKEQGRNARAFQADLREPMEVERLFEHVVSSFGRLDVLVTAAAIYEPRRWEEVTADDLRRNFEINTMGTFLCCQKAGLLMARQPEGGAIITIGDWATQRPYPDYVAYLISKGSIPTLTRALAVEMALRNPAVRVNCILPGPVMLPPDLSPAERERAIAGTLVQREGRPEHVAHAVLFLAENEFVTGVCLPVDGGRTIGGTQCERAE